MNYKSILTVVGLSLLLNSCNPFNPIRMIEHAINTQPLEIEIQTNPPVIYNVEIPSEYVVIDSVVKYSTYGNGRYGMVFDEIGIEKIGAYISVRALGFSEKANAYANYNLSFLSPFDHVEKVYAENVMVYVRLGE